ncbi:hypothetical protein GRAN_1519 [Granulicella sibirica]|uniref:Uncharacterized protein n=1 Tax=Granulicella sibirica TaxID=2479048 RepID=A0A4Q0T847_9BACT|nr:hypothetical protein GRAN_1519 [Granulicella sibirica]
MRIVESYTFERDRLSDVPLNLAPAESFTSDSTLRELVRSWQRDVPMRSLRGATWRRPHAFYVQVGTEDSLGSSLPPGAVALVEPIDAEELRQPQPRSIYLLQFPNGYRCSGCMVIRGKLYLLTSERTYAGPQEFSYPGSVRIAGRIRMFATQLPLPEYSTVSLAKYHGSGELLLPWEHETRDRLLATMYRRFQRSHDEERSVRQFLEMEFRSKVSERTLRRYRSPNRSEPHVDVLLTLALMHSTRYTDALQSGGYTIRDTSRFSLEFLLMTKTYADLLVSPLIASTPIPREVWETRRQEFAEWPSLLAVKFPKLRIWDDRVIRLAKEKAIEGLNPVIKPGSWMLLEPLSSVPDTRVDARKQGWSQPIYVLRRGVEILCGRLVREGNRFVLLANPKDVSSKIMLDADDLRDVSRVSGVAVPV